MFITPLSLIYPENGEQRTENRRERKTDVLKKGNEGRLKTKKTSKEGGGQVQPYIRPFVTKFT